MCRSCRAFPFVASSPIDTSPQENIRIRSRAFLVGGWNYLLEQLDGSHPLVDPHCIFWAFKAHGSRKLSCSDASWATVPFPASMVWPRLDPPKKEKEMVQAKTAPSHVCRFPKLLLCALREALEGQSRHWAGERSELILHSTTAACFTATQAEAQSREVEMRAVPATTATTAATATETTTTTLAKKNTGK